MQRKGKEAENIDIKSVLERSGETLSVGASAILYLSPVSGASVSEPAGETVAHSPLTNAFVQYFHTFGVQKPMVCISG